MTRARSFVLQVMVAAAMILIFGASRVQAQAQAPVRLKAAPTPVPGPGGAGSEEDDDPFAVEAAPALPPGMIGSDASDPRAKLTPGFYDAGETAMGLKHVQLLKKPEAFQLGAAEPDDPKVQKMLGQLGVRDLTKIPKPMQLVIAQLAFANSDLAFQGNHVFEGNFYGANIYDISNAANATLLTTLVCPGGQGDLSVHGKLLFMSVEMPNGRLDCGTQGFPAEPAPAKGQEKERKPPAAQKDRFRGVRIFDISDLRNPKQVAAVQTCRGSHTHTLVVDPNDKENVYIYVSGDVICASSGRTGGMFGGKAGEGSEYGAVSHRCDQGSAGGSARGENSGEPAGVY